MYSFGLRRQPETFQLKLGYVVPCDAATKKENSTSRRLLDHEDSSPSHVQAAPSAESKPANEPPSETPSTLPLSPRGIISDGQTSKGDAPVLAQLCLEWAVQESEDNVLDRLDDLKDQAIAKYSEHVALLVSLVVVTGSVSNSGSGAATHERLAVQIRERRRRPTLYALEALRTSSSSSSSGGDSVVSIMTHCELEDVRELTVGDGAALCWTKLLPRWSNLASLNLSNCNLGTLPAELCRLPLLEELNVSGNRLTCVKLVGDIRALRVLRVDANLLTTVAGEICKCSSLQMLSLESNKLMAPVLHLNLLPRLHTLRLSGNPIEFLPELSPCVHLRHLTLANVRVTANEQLDQVEVKEVSSSSSYLNLGGRTGNKTPWSGFFSLIFRHSAVQHPLIASAVARMAMDKSIAETISGADGAIQQILSMTLSNSLHVVSMGCRTLSAMAQSPATALRLMKAKVMQSLYHLLGSEENAAKEDALQVISDLAFSSEEVSAQMCTPFLLATLMSLADRSACGAVQAGALLALGNLAFEITNRRRQLAMEGLRELLTRLAAGAADGAATPPARPHSSSGNHTPPLSPQGSGEQLVQSLLEAVQSNAEAAKKKSEAGGAQPPSATSLSEDTSVMNSKLKMKISGSKGVKWAAMRTLAILGENAQVRRALAKPPLARRGVRILAMDGGGMRGLATIEMLREMERQSGRRIHEMFDLIGGTSSGGILAVSVGIMQFTCDDCETLYRKLGVQVFGQSEEQAGAGSEEAGRRAPHELDPELRIAVPPAPGGGGGGATWRERIDALYKSSAQGLRVAVYGCKHDASNFETLIRRACSRGPFYADQPMIDTALEAGPKVFTVAAMVSVAPVQPYIFRNYQYPEPPTGYNPGGFAFERKGSCKHALWQSVRASSAAPYYLEDYAHENQRWHDGAVVANNPSYLAIEEARALWPDRPIDCVVSVGSGSVGVRDRPNMSSISRYIDAGQALMESACSVQKVDEQLSVLLPMIPGCKYFRLQPTDREKCDLELDQTDPENLDKLVAATKDYITNSAKKFQLLASYLKSNDDGVSPERSSKLRAPKTVGDSVPRSSKPLPLGLKRSVVLFQADRNTETSKSPLAADAVEQICARDEIPFLRVDMARLNHTQGDAAEGPGMTRAKTLHTALTQTLHEQWRQLRVVHLALHDTSKGLVLGWRQDMHAVAEPGDTASSFLARAVRQGSNSSACTSLHQLCSSQPYFEVDEVLHKYVSQHVQTINGQETRAFLLQRTLPDIVLDANVVRGMVGLWRDCIVVSSTQVEVSLLSSLIYAGAKVVVGPSINKPHIKVDNEDLSHFFQVFYASLYSADESHEGDHWQSPEKAVFGAIAKVPSCAHFCCHMLVCGDSDYVDSGLVVEVASLINQTQTETFS